MAETTFFANQVQITSGSETVAIGKGAEFKVTFKYNELYGFKSIKRQGVAKYEARVEVKIKAAKFDKSLASGLAKSYGFTLNGSGSSTAASITDTNSVGTFTVVGACTGSDSTVMTLTVADVYFEDLPFNASENEWIVFDVSGVGSDLTIS